MIEQDLENKTCNGFPFEDPSPIVYENNEREFSLIYTNDHNITNPYNTSEVLHFSSTSITGYDTSGNILWTLASATLGTFLFVPDFIPAFYNDNGEIYLLTIALETVNSDYNRVKIKLSDRSFVVSTGNIPYGDYKCIAYSIEDTTVKFISSYVPSKVAYMNNVDLTTMNTNTPQDISYFEASFLRLLNGKIRIRTLSDTESASFTSNGAGGNGIPTKGHVFLNMEVTTPLGEFNYTFDIPSTVNCPIINWYMNAPNAVKISENVIMLNQADQEGTPSYGGSWSNTQHSHKYWSVAELEQWLINIIKHYTGQVIS